MTIKRTIKPRKSFVNNKQMWYVHVPKTIRHIIGKSRARLGSKKAAAAFAADLSKKCAMLENRRQLAAISREFADCPSSMQVAKAAVEEKLALESLPLADAFAQVIAAKKQSGKRANSVSSLTCSLKSFAKACQKPVGDVLPADVEAWLYANDWTPQTRKGRHIDVKTAFNWLVRRNLVKKNPATVVDAPAVAFKKPEILTVDAIEKILRACEQHDPALLGHLVMILFGGLRRGESARASPENIVGGVIELTGDQTKLNIARNVKINDTLAAWLAVPGVELGGKHLFKRMKKIRELAGVEIPQNALRHSAASYWRELLGGIESARLLGHSESVSLKSYATKVTRADAERFIALRPIQTQTPKQP